MKIDLTHTTAAEISRALLRGRRALGAPAAVGRALTLVVVTDETHADRALTVAREAFRETPSRVIVAVDAGRAAEPGLDAEISCGAVETIVLRLRGEPSRHPESAVLPLLPADTPVVVWWPHDAPPAPVRTPLGRAADLRLVDTDTDTAPHPVAALARRAAHHACGDVDLAWIRTGWWRAALLAVLRDSPGPWTAARVLHGPEPDASAVLLAHWLSARARIPTALEPGPRGRGIAGVRLTGDRPVSLHLTDHHAVWAAGAHGTYRLARPGITDASVLREAAGHFGPDAAYESALSHFTDTTTLEPV
jgi:glucose-6-phosphate dehydrogenase assembly protein OpcA